ncbi:hypothetical protein COT75_02525 [Candidatus Beckwithbacteria bacterium CG10_big_fil_rev_8_21_14_0_10_34_10]|uniref:Nucleoside triphosphate pyrophosphatase n=1 Tax=Candidatus Beckwithbacteria bacterium CG10_big_fil_rev_8_21_14_0_10_34_10 TaxID=1974495 RepID=A0A2H0W9A3_9BACT|nr:MAG: hypothetical protein COT75_02525 [Candidatus Beckwithbacteria bacterium CG10_big_fil_rev_8_21_14_0_10_34_10]
MVNIVLASGSKNRQKLLRALGISFKMVVSNFAEEKIKEGNFSLRARKIAMAKAKKVAEKEKGLIIACDTYTVLGGKLMEKPKDLSQAKNMLKQLSGKMAVCYTGFCFFNSVKNECVAKTVTSKVFFRKIYKEELDDYVKKFPVMSWAAAYAPSNLYGLGLIKKVIGSLTGLTHGLSIELLIPLLAKQGFKPKPLGI